MKYKTITLTVDQWDTIKDSVENYADEGPTPTGWQSESLLEASSALTEALETNQPTQQP